jgi:hypothetical protein
MPSGLSDAYAGAPCVRTGRQLSACQTESILGLQEHFGVHSGCAVARRGCDDRQLAGGVFAGDVEDVAAGEGHDTQEAQRDSEEADGRQALVWQRDRRDNDGKHGHRRDQDRGDATIDSFLRPGDQGERDDAVEQGQQRDLADSGSIEAKGTPSHRDNGEHDQCTESQAPGDNLDRGDLVDEDLHVEEGRAEEGAEDDKDEQGSCVQAGGVVGHR